MKIIAHRGSNLKAPENTVAAINWAWIDNADGVEVDIRLTADKKIVAMHDDNTLRVTGVSKSVELSSYKSLESLLVRNIANTLGRPERIPLLQDVIENMIFGKKLFLEIKCGEEIIPHLKSELSNSKYIPNYNISIVSFSSQVLDLAGKMMPNVNRFKLVNFYKTNNLTVEEIIENALANGYNGIGVAGEMHKCIECIRKAKKSNLLTNVWTEDDPVKADIYRQEGLDYLTTNNPPKIGTKTHPELILSQEPYALDYLI